MDDIQQLHNGRAVVGNGRLASVVHHELVHAAGTQSRADGIHDGLASVDVANELSLALRRVCALLQQDNSRALKT